jgi:hypothetical protein
MPVAYTPESATGPVLDYGMGWNIQPYQGHHLVHHGGWVEGYVSWISFMPFDNIGVVVLCNMSDCELPNLLQYVIYDRLLGLDKIDWDKILDNYEPKYLSRSYKIKMSAELDPARLPLPPEEFAGTFEHPGYGRIEIVMENQKLYALFNGEKMELIHFHDAVFVTEHPLQGFSGKKVSFILNDLGKIEKLEMALQQGVHDIVFVRIDD